MTTAARLELPDNPFLQGAFAPIRHEYAFDSLPLTGEVPDCLSGSFYRNGLMFSLHRGVIITCLLAMA